jgi:hypothetical protein
MRDLGMHLFDEKISFDSSESPKKIVLLPRAREELDNQRTKETPNTIFKVFLKAGVDMKTVFQI